MTTTRYIHIPHSDWLLDRGYRRFDNRGMLFDSPDKVLFQKRFDTVSGELFIEVNVYDYSNLPGGIRYEVAVQLNGSITMNVTIFTLFNNNLVERLPGIELIVLKHLNHAQNAITIQ